MSRPIIKIKDIENPYRYSECKSVTLRVCLHIRWGTRLGIKRRHYREYNKEKSEMITLLRIPLDPSVYNFNRLKDTGTQIKLGVTESRDTTHTRFR